MSQRDQLVVRVAVVGDEGEDSLGNPVDGGEGVLHRPNQTQYLQHILLENVHLEAQRSSITVDL